MGNSKADASKTGKKILFESSLSGLHGYIAPHPLNLKILIEQTFVIETPAFHE
jgi:hypothetical protein